MNPVNLHRALICGLLALFLSLPASAANQAGTAVFVSGKATATDTYGMLRVLHAKDPVYSGDLLETGKGRIQIKYLDGAFMSIQPNSRFQIETYNYENRSDGSEKAVYNILKGGMRAFTGAIGKKNPDAYKVKTPVATIGIRGTGHNTRICSGDCTSAAGLPVPDGLYHSTWEGITTVANEFGTFEVTAGKSVFVAGIDAPAQESSSASPVTSVQSSGGGGGGSEAPPLQTGEQVSSDGIPAGIPAEIAADIAEELGTGSPTTPASPPTALHNQTLIGIEPDLQQDFNDIGYADEGIFTTTTVLVGADRANMDGLVAAIGVEYDETGKGGVEIHKTLLTIDPDGILANNSADSNIADAREFIEYALDQERNDLAAASDAAAVSEVSADPARVAEYETGSFLGNDYAYGRWSDGKVLIIDEDINEESPFFGEMTAEADTLADGRNLHWLFGDAANTNFGQGATGTYVLLTEKNGTASSNTNGGPLGAGVQSGSLQFDFNSLNGEIVDMVVQDNNTNYTVNGDLIINPSRQNEFHDAANVYAAADTQACGESDCQTLIDGSFFGSLAQPLNGDPGGAPVLAGLDYEIILPVGDESGEAVIGNALFGREGTADPIGLELVGHQALLGIETNLYQDGFNPDNADGGIVTDAEIYVGEDSAGNYGLAGVFGTEVDESNIGEFETLQLLVTIDPDGVEGTSGAARDLLEAATLYQSGELAATVNSAKTNRATVVPGSHTADSYGSTDYAYGRWTDGNILFIDVIQDGPNAGEITAEIDNIAVDQNFHYLHGDAPDTNFAAGATGTYALLPSNNGTASTDTHDGFVGNGVQSGSLEFDFTSLNGRIVDMVIDHSDIHTVNGNLQINSDQPGEFIEVEHQVFSKTTTGPCSETSCETIIEGSFFGALSGAQNNDPGGAPELAGLAYEIITRPVNGISGNSVIGNALLGRSGPAEPISSFIPGQGLTATFLVEGLTTTSQINDTISVIGGDSMNTRGLLTTISSQSMGEEGFTGLVTIDPLGLLDIDDMDQSIIQAKALVSAAQGNAIELVAVNTAIDHPAIIAEFFQGDGFAYGRWAAPSQGDGNILALNNFTPAVVYTLAGGTDQSLHFFTGDTPQMPTAGSGATGTYRLINGTHSTSFSGATIGNGVIDGTLTFNFDIPTAGTIDMTVRHGLDYNVSGNLAIDANMPGTFFDAGGVNAITDSGPCAMTGGCYTEIEGRFAGALSGTGGNSQSPEFAGLGYDIYGIDGGYEIYSIEGIPEGIMGAAAFERIGDGPAPVVFQ